MWWLGLLGCQSSSTPVAPTQPIPTVKANRPADAPPNIVILLADDAGYADFSLTGSKTFRTPAIDALAADGVTFTNAYVTAPVCSPSRAGLLTGRYQQRFGHEGNPPLAGGPKSGLPVEETLISDHLKAAGYTTAVFGKWHLGYEPHFHPNARGFDTFEGVLRGERTYFAKADATDDLAAWRRDGAVVDESFDYVTDAIADATVDFMVDHRDGPFLAYVAFTGVHFPLEARPDDIARQPRSLQGPRRTLAAMTTGLDRAVGQITAAIDGMGLTNDTLVFFINDNGAGKKNHGDNSPWRSGKGRLFEGGTHVPYVLRWPGHVPAGSRLDPLVSSLDVVPTALVAAGVPLPTDRPLDGRDLTAVTKGGPGADVLYWRLGKSWAVRDARFKIVSDKGTEPQLFDLSTDPGETTDVRAAHPEQYAALKARYDAWNAEMIEPVFLSATEVRRQRRAKAPR